MTDIYYLYKTNENFVKSIVENKRYDKLLDSCSNGNNLIHILVDEGDILGFKILMCMLKEIKSTKNSLVQRIINQQNGDKDTPAHIAVRKSEGKDNMYNIYYHFPVIVTTKE